MYFDVAQAGESVSMHLTNLCKNQHLCGKLDTAV